MAQSEGDVLIPVDLEVSCLVASDTVRVERVMGALEEALRREALARLGADEEAFL